MNRNRWVVAVVSSVFALCGCHHEHKERVALSQMVLPPNTESTTLGDPGIAVPHNSYVTLTSNRTEGMFPSSLAVVRVESPEFLPGGFVPTTLLAMKPINEMIDWMDLFDDVWSISDVFPVTYPMSKDRQVTPEALVPYARSDGAGLCLIYEIVTSHANDITTVDVRGTLYNARNGNMLVAAHANARVRDLAEDQLPPPPPVDRVEADRRHVDPWFIAQQRFRDLVRQSILELVAQDKKTLAPPRPKRMITSDPVLQIRRSSQRRLRWPH